MKAISVCPNTLSIKVMATSDIVNFTIGGPKQLFSNDNGTSVISPSEIHVLNEITPLFYYAAIAL